MSTLARCVIAILAIAVFGSISAEAQVAATPTSQSVTSFQTAMGPTLAGTTAGVRATAPVSEQRSNLASALQDEPNMGRNVALMVVGGAALITGLLIDSDAGTVIAVSGAIVGLYGLYQWVR